MRLRYNRRALQQIDHALSYVARKSPSGAANISSRLVAILELVQLQPQAGLKTQMPAVRRIFLTPHPYLVDYQIDDEEIIVLRFRHTSRRPLPGSERT